MYDDVVEESGKSKQTLKDIKWFSDKVKPSCRQDNLSFEHHKQVKSDTRVSDLSYAHHREIASLEPKQQKELLQKAVDEDLSVRESREAV